MIAGSFFRLVLAAVLLLLVFQMSVAAPPIAPKPPTAALVAPPATAAPAPHAQTGNLSERRCSSCGWQVSAQITRSAALSE